MARYDEPGRDAPDFTPVPVRYRHDGWTPQRQKAFIEKLAETACVEEAARRVGMTPQSARALRRRSDASLFRDAWEAALSYSSIHLVEESAMKRSIHGVARPIFFHGEQVGEWRYFDERLTIWLLRYRHPRRYGAWRDQHPPAADPAEDTEAEHLDWLLNEFDEQIMEEKAEDDSATDDGGNAFPSRE
jgi:hypothetical protein